MDRVIVCSFSGALADLPKGKRTTLAALQVLEKRPRVSTFDRCELPWLSRLLDDLLRQGLVLEVDEPYPWHRYELMTAGRQMLARLKPPNVADKRHGTDSVTGPLDWLVRPLRTKRMKVKDDLGDRMKLYEGMEAGRRLMPLLPALARIDGRAFHSFTRGMDRPFDAAFSACMVDTTAALVRDTGACMGYTQSDEITLAWHARTTQSQIWFDGRVAKMTSQLAAQATLIFYRLVLERMPQYAGRLPTFDARVWNVPNRAEGANVFLWREWDATKNSVSMAASAYYSHKALMGKNSPQKHDMLHAKGVNWNDYPALFKRGAYVQRRTVAVPFSADELDRLPPKHEARTNPALVVERSVCSVLDMPPLGTVTNREAVIFDGAGPNDGGVAHAPR